MNELFLFIINLRKRLVKQLYNKGVFTGFTAAFSDLHSIPYVYYV